MSVGETPKIKATVLQKIPKFVPNWLSHRKFSSEFFAISLFLPPQKFLQAALFKYSKMLSWLDAA